MIGVAPTPTGQGYWIATSTGMVLTFGDAVDLGSPADLGEISHDPIVALSASRNTFGYWTAGTDGSVWAFGDTYFLGHAPVDSMIEPVIAFAAVPGT